MSALGEQRVHTALAEPRSGLCWREFEEKRWRSWERLSWKVRAHVWSRSGGKECTHILALSPNTVLKKKRRPSRLVATVFEVSTRRVATVPKSVPGW
eukprot:684932-Rhodomonas_salina.2